MNSTKSIETWPLRYARTGGILYLFIIVAAFFGEVYVRNSLIVWGNAAATASNIQASVTLFRTGLAAEMLTCVCDITLAMILYVLLKPVNKNLALLAAFFRLAFVCIYAVSKLFEVAALSLLGETGSLANFQPAQLHDLAYVSLRVHSYGYGVSLLFFGFCCVLFGYLISQSGYLPRILGALLMTGGLGYVVFSITQILSPDLAARFLFPWSILPAFIAELLLCLWLIVKGINMAKWEEKTQRKPI